MRYDLIRALHSAVDHAIRLVDILGTHDPKDEKEKIVLEKLYDLSRCLGSWRDV